MPDNLPDTILSPLAQRKKVLLAQGALYRAGVNESRAVVRENLHPGVMAKSAVNHLAATASAAFDNIFRLKNFNAGNLQILLPLLTSGFSLLSRRGLIRPILRGAVVVATMGTASYFLFRKHTPRHESISDDTPIY